MRGGQSSITGVSFCCATLFQSKQVDPDAMWMDLCSLESGRRFKADDSIMIAVNKLLARQDGKICATCELNSDGWELRDMKHIGWVVIDTKTSLSRCFLQGLSKCRRSWLKRQALQIRETCGCYHEHGTEDLRIRKLARWLMVSFPAGILRCLTASACQSPMECSSSSRDSSFKRPGSQVQHSNDIYRL